MSKRIPYDPEQMCEMWRQGKPIAEICAVTGLRPSTIYKYVRHKYNMPSRESIQKHSILSYPDRRRFLEQNYANASASVIAAILGVAADTVRRTAKRIGLRHSEEYVRADYAYRAKKISAYWQTHERKVDVRPRDTKGHYLRLTTN